MNEIKMKRDFSIREYFPDRKGVLGLVLKGHSLQVIRDDFKAREVD